MFGLSRRDLLTNEQKYTKIKLYTYAQGAETLSIMTVVLEELWKS